MAGGIAFGGAQQSIPPSLPGQSLRDPRRAWMPLRIRVLLQRGRLDQMLADGVDPGQTPVLSLRAQQLQALSQRRRLASGLERLVAQADRRQSGGGSTVPINRREIIRARALLLQLTERLRDPAAACPRGVAIIRRLLTDDSSPIFSPAWSGRRPAQRALERHARAALAAFDGQPADLPPGDRSQR